MGFLLHTLLVTYTTTGGVGSCSAVSSTRPVGVYPRSIRKTLISSSTYLHPTPYLPCRTRLHPRNFVSLRLVPVGLPEVRRRKRQKRRGPFGDWAEIEKVRCVCVYVCVCSLFLMVLFFAAAAASSHGEYTVNYT